VRFLLLLLLPRWLLLLLQMGVVQGSFVTFLPLLLWR
jgi:hypothetical protein